MTTPTELQRLEGLFHQVVDLGDRERARVLEALRRHQPTLHDRLHRLLERDGAEGAQSPLLDLVGDVAELGAGDLVGPFRLLRPLGEGGMGRVFEAEQETPVRRRVALKLMRPGLWGVSLRVRFARERQALAAMSHPGIARVFEAGATADGRPWVAMELIDGPPITAYCNARRLPITERLMLVVQVARAVQHAHQKGVLHRDLKPSNVLVSDQDGEPTPKIIDFGLAKSIDEAGLGPGDRTRIGEVMGTPEYMSPEQALGRSVDTRSDIYSLAVITYELLTGALPIGDGDGGEPVADDELRRRLRDDEPRRPSSRVGATGGRGPEIAAARGTDLRSLRRALRGDLDWVLVRALAKEPDRRYDSAAAFAADLEAHLRDQPVEAGPPSGAYRAGKFFRRHRVGVAAGALVVVALIAATAVSSSLYLRAEAARRGAETERRKSEEVNAFLQQTLGRADPVESQSREDLPVRTILDEAAWRIPTTLGDQPQVAAALHLTIGNAYRNLGLDDRALDNLGQALELRERAGDRGGVIEARLALAEVRMARGEHEQAEALARRALAESSTRSVAGSPWGARARWLLGRVMARRGDYEAAEATFRRALAATRSVGDPEVEARVRRDLGLLLADRGRLAEAIPELEAAVARRRDALGPDHSEVAEALSDLAWVLTKVGQEKRALELSREALATVERVYPSDHPQVALARDGVAAALTEMGRYAEAIAERERVVASFRRSLGDGHVYVAHALNNLALALELQGDVRRAIDVYREATDRYQAILGREHPDLASARNNLARAYRVHGDREAAERECRESLRIRRAVLAPGHPDIARNLHLLAELRHDAGDRVAALALLEEALELRERALPPGHVLIASTLYLLGEVEHELARDGRARTHLARSLALYQALAATAPEIHGASVDKVRAALAELGSPPAG